MLELRGQPHLCRRIILAGVKSGETTRTFLASKEQRGLRVPKWQVISHGGLLPKLRRLFNLLGCDSWTVYRFLIQSNCDFRNLPFRLRVAAKLKVRLPSLLPT